YVTRSKEKEVYYYQEGTFNFLQFFKVRGKENSRKFFDSNIVIREWNSNNHELPIPTLLTDFP
ncbi:hypothetical protein LRR74_28530, partial [Klebsiella pneumoniae]|nr:hypothetical protein [Klebsiella pneumoniae]